MKSLRYLAYITSVVFLISCSEEETKEQADDKQQEKNVVVINGVVERNTVAQEIGHIGTPDIAALNGETFICYPIPVSDVLAFSVFKSEYSELTVLVVKAEGPAEVLDSLNILSIETVTSSDTVYSGSLDHNTQPIRLDVSDFDEGFYRVYLNIDGESFIDDILVLK